MHSSFFHSLGYAVSNEMNLEPRPLKYDKWVIYCAMTYQSFMKEGIWGDFTGESWKTGQDQGQVY